MRGLAMVKSTREAGSQTIKRLREVNLIGALGRYLKLPKELISSVCSAPNHARA
jgi:hypothetical protein